jgi:hypothetical protein
MQNAVVETDAYLSIAGKIMSVEEMESVVTVISAAAMSGDVIPVARGLRKLRVPLQGRGKRGGGRVIYWYYNEGYPAVLLWAFAKNAASDLTVSQRKSLVGLAENFLENYGSKS